MMKRWNDIFSRFAVYAFHRFKYIRKRFFLQKKPSNINSRAWHIYYNTFIS